MIFALATCLPLACYLAASIPSAAHEHSESFFVLLKLIIGPANQNMSSCLHSRQCPVKATVVYIFERCRLRMVSPAYHTFVSMANGKRALSKIHVHAC